MDQPVQLINPLDDLRKFDKSALPSPPHVHSSGRRELRTAILSRGITITARARSAKEQDAALLKGEACLTLPIKRKEEKYGGMTKKAWKKLRRESRNS